MFHVDFNQENNFKNISFKGKSSEPSTPERNFGAVGVNGGSSVINEELHNKIEENAQLHKQLHELSGQMDGQVRALQVSRNYFYCVYHNVIIAL